MQHIGTGTPLLPSPHLVGELRKDMQDGEWHCGVVRKQFRDPPLVRGGPDERHFNTTRQAKRIDEGRKNGEVPGRDCFRHDIAGADGLVYQCDACLAPVFLRFGVKTYEDTSAELLQNLRISEADFDA